MKLTCLYRGRSLAATLILTLCVASVACGGTSPITGEAPAQLSSLTIAPSGELSPPFSTAITSYAATVPTDLPSLIVTAESDASDATISINGMMVPSGANQSVSLGPPGMPTPIEVAVLSADGEATTYVITVTRLAKCAIASGEDCCPGDYQERECGIGSCGKQSRLCSAAGKWEEWSACGTNSARAGQVCRVKAPGNDCDPVEVCGAAVDCPADTTEYTVAGQPGCWKDQAATSFHPGSCPPGHACRYHEPTAARICADRGFSRLIGFSQSKTAGAVIYLGYWTGSGWTASQIDTGGYSMTSVTCLK